MENEKLVYLLVSAIVGLCGACGVLFTLYRRQVEARIRNAERLSGLLNRSGRR